MTAPPNIWMIGDLQGCCAPLEQLLAHPVISADTNAQFWFAGDLVNRGPNSLETLKYIMAMGDQAVCVLGNHDLHLLAIAAGIKKPGKSDTTADILNSPQADELINWLRRLPIAHYAHNHLLVHAGVLANWDVAKVMTLAGEVEGALRSPDWKDKLQEMYGNEPAYWSDGLAPGTRLRVIVNALTRIRMCNEQGHMEFAHKGSPAATGEGLIAWFDVPGRATRNQTVVFGHWSTLGLMVRPDAICLDTGCVWGGDLTALRMHDHKLVQIACGQYQKPGGSKSVEAVKAQDLL